MNIKILGGGCASCKKLYENTKKAVTEAMIKADVEYITDMQKIMEYGVQQKALANEAGKAEHDDVLMNQIQKRITGLKTDKSAVWKPANCLCRFSEACKDKGNIGQLLRGFQQGIGALVPG